MGVQVGDADEPALGLGADEEVHPDGVTGVHDQGLVAVAGEELGIERGVLVKAAVGQLLHLPDRGAHRVLVGGVHHVVAAVRRAALDDRVRVELQLEERLVEQGDGVGVGDGAAPPERRADVGDGNPAVLGEHGRPGEVLGGTRQRRHRVELWLVMAGAAGRVLDVLGVVRNVGDAEGPPAAAAGAAAAPAAGAAAARNKPPVLRANVAANRKRILSRAISFLLKAADRLVQPLTARSARS